MNVIELVEKDYERSDIPEFREGDTVRVHVKIKEGNRFTVRRIASGVGVEKTFPVSSPLLEKVEVVQRGHVRRAKLNYMRERTGKSAKIRPSKKQNA